MVSNLFKKWSKFPDVALYKVSIQILENVESNFKAQARFKKALRISYFVGEPTNRK
jgi:hypothetical protein